MVKHIFYVHHFSPRKLGKWSYWTLGYSPNGLVQPPTSILKKDNLYFGTWFSLSHIFGIGLVQLAPWKLQQCPLPLCSCCFMCFPNRFLEEFPSRRTVELNDATMKFYRILGAPKLEVLLLEMAFWSDFWWKWRIVGILLFSACFFFFWGGGG